MASSSSKKRKSSSSSSHKKKPSKSLSSTVKRNRSKNGKREKSRKLRHSRRDASLSYSDDNSWSDDSIAISSSGSEEDNRSRKYDSRSRSRTRGTVKESKKKVKRSLSSESPRPKKKKVYKRVDESKEKKKSSKKKHGNGKYRRSVSVDSRSSDSWSCSTCNGVSSSSESDSELSRGRYDGKEKRLKRSLVSTNDKRQFDGYDSEERLTSKRNPPRLKSVLTIVKGSEEEVVRDEIFQASDDCPSSRSIDRYNVGQKVEKKILVGSANIEEDSFTSKTAKLPENCKANTGVEHVSIPMTKEVIRSEVSFGVDNTRCEDLESILREKALENLIKFRGVPHAKQECVDKQPDSSIRLEKISNPKTDSVVIKVAKEAIKNIVGDRRATTQKIKNIPFKHESKDKSHDGTNPAINVKESVLDSSVSDKAYNESDIKSTQHSSTFKQKAVVDSSVSNNLLVSRKSVKERCLDTKKNPEKYCNNNVTTIHGSSNSLLTLVKAPEPENNYFKGRCLDAKNIPEKNSSETLKAVHIVSNTIIEEVDTLGSVALEASSVAVIPKASAVTVSTAVPEASSSVLEPPTSHKDMTKGGSEFEQKTMTVMRGGDLVKVNYKVYIPNKKPDLARRQLRR